MKKLTAKQQKALKTIHLVFVSIWFSSVVTLMLLPILSQKITNGDELYMYNVAYHFIDMFILTPAAVVVLLTGLVYSIFTKWGFAKHGWIIYKWIVTLVIIITGTFYLGPMVENLLEIADTKRINALYDVYYLQSESIGLYAAIINATLLAVAIGISVYKPRKSV